MIDVYHCPKCGRLLTCEGVLPVDGHELPVFQCEHCIVKKTIFGPGSEPFEMAYTFCVDSAGRFFDPTDGVGDGPDAPNLDDDPGPDPSLN